MAEPQWVETSEAEFYTFNPTILFKEILTQPTNRLLPEKSAKLSRYMSTITAKRLHELWSDISRRLENKDEERAV